MRLRLNILFLITLLFFFKKDKHRYEFQVKKNSFLINSFI